MKYFYICTLLLLVGFAHNGSAQTTEKPNLFEFNLEFKNMHYWRGYAVSKSPVLAPSVYYQSPNGNWKMGFWGGMSFDGSYREFDYFISYQKGGFSASLWDIYNFSVPEIQGKGYFDYNNQTTGRFIDLTLAYDFSAVFPFSISTSTILHGRDSAPMPSELDPFRRRGVLRYTSYIEGTYTFVKNDKYTLSGFVGGSVALSGAETTFYTSQNAINFVGFTYSKVLDLGGYMLPVRATPAWNPDAGHAFMEIAISFF